MPKRVSSVLVVAVFVAACTSSGTSAPSGREASDSPGMLPTAAVTAAPTVAIPAQQIESVSASKPSVEERRVFESCHLGDDDLVPFDRVTGMGSVAEAKDLVRYVPLTGREPQLKEPGTVWMVTIDFDLPQPGSSEVWADPTCIVTDQESGWFATGPVTNTATGEVMQPEPPSKEPDLVLPPLVP